VAEERCRTQAAGFQAQIAELHATAARRAARLQAAHKAQGEWSGQLLAGWGGV
jgi:hypothetical protein